MKINRRVFGSGLAAIAASLSPPVRAAGFVTNTAPRRRFISAELYLGLFPRRGPVTPQLRAMIDDETKSFVNRARGIPL